MTDRPESPNFAFYYATDAYSTAAKIMGRQSAGKALLKGVARLWPQGEIHAMSPRRDSAVDMLTRLQQDGYSGTLRLRPMRGDAVLDELGAVYYPAPLTTDLVWDRNARGAASYSLFGVTHTMSSHSAMDAAASLILPPYKPWDGLICTSRAALTVVEDLQAELRDWYARSIGATHFNLPAMPIIPLGVNAPDFKRDADAIASARRAFEISENEVVFLFAGRLVFHAKANPAPMYQALEAASRQLKGGLVCIEAGVYGSELIIPAYEQARRELAPSVRFIHVDGSAEDDYIRAWHAADVFTSLSDNVQETFGLTPVEAMASGLPVLVSDWNGYRDTVRDGIDGFMVPVTAPGGAEGAGDELAQRYSDSLDSYDVYVGRTSMATAIDPKVLRDRIIRLASDPQLRRQMGEAGRKRAAEEFDWPVVLRRYHDFAAGLGELRRAAKDVAPQLAEQRPLRPDPFRLFQHYSTATIDGSWRVSAVLGDAQELQRLMSLNVVNFMLSGPRSEADVVVRLHAAATEEMTVEALLGLTGAPRDRSFRAMMWLVKLGMLTARP